MEPWWDVTWEAKPQATDIGQCLVTVLLPCTIDSCKLELAEAKMMAANWDQGGDSGTSARREEYKSKAEMWYYLWWFSYDFVLCSSCNSWALNSGLFPWRPYVAMDNKMNFWFRSFWKMSDGQNFRPVLLRLQLTYPEEGNHCKLLMSYCSCRISFNSSASELTSDTLHIKDGLSK